MTDLGSHQESLKQAATFLQAQVIALPFGLRVATRLSLAIFRGYVRLTSFRAFQRLTLIDRVRSAERWASGPIAPARQLFRALRSLALLAYFEQRCPKRKPREIRHDDPHSKTIDTDVVVIGSGAGGAVTAMELASRGHRVLIVEEGHAPESISADPGATDSVAALYRRRGMTPILGRVPIAYVEGCCLGGSTELNSGFWHRPPAETLLRWKAQYALDAASPHELCPHWQWAESLLGVRRHEGPLPMSSQVFARGAAAMQWAVDEVPRTAARARAGRHLEPGEPRAGGMSGSLIPRAVTSGATVLTGYRAVRLDMHDSRADGALLRATDPNAADPVIRVRAGHIFVCAGAMETPSLLRRSGIVHNVGDSLRIHPMLKVAGRFKDPVGSEDASLPLLQVKEFWPDLVLGGAYFSRSHLAVILANNWRATHDRIRAIDHMACYYVGVRGTGRGKVRPSRWRDGATQIHYELSDEDIWNLSRGVARLSALLLEGGAVEVLPAVSGLSPITSEVDAIKWLDDRLDGRACSLTTVHAFSSCPIGERRDRCAADSYGKLHGLDNVYINDASMIPDSPGVNPQGTIMTLARRNVQHFCDEHGA